MSVLDPRRIPEALEQAGALDRVAGPAASAVSRTLQGPVKDVLSGKWLGHAAHPLLTDLPIGAWTSALFLDLFGGRRAQPAADALVAAGVVAAVPAAATGTSDWSDLGTRARRVGLIHATANVVALALYGASLAARRSGRRGRGVALSLAGATALSAGGYLGGHLVSRLAAGVSRTATVEPPEDWTAVADLGQLPQGASAADAGGVAVLLVRDGDRVCALADTCSHLGGPLHEGEVDGDTVTCPWHASTFSLTDGAVVHGPASAPQPAFDVRTTGGKVEVRGRSAA